MAKLFERGKKTKDNTQETTITFDQPEAIDFKNKKFYLSGNFSTLKKEIGKDLEDLGAIHVTKFALKNTDYLILAENGVKHLGKQKSHGDKAEAVQKHNNEKNQERHIPIIKENHCKQLMESAKKDELPKP